MDAYLGRFVVSGLMFVPVLWPALRMTGRKP